MDEGIERKEEAEGSESSERWFSGHAMAIVLMNSQQPWFPT